MRMQNLIVLAQNRLTVAEVEEAGFEASYLARCYFGFDSTALYLHLDDQVDQEAFWCWVERRAQGEPSAYIVGKQEFYGRSFMVNRNVLIPRPETEVLVEAVLQNYRGRMELTIFDVGTGSGNIAITLAKELNFAKVFGLDISVEALEVAKQNAEKLDAKVEFIQSDLLTNAPFGGADIITANLPYVADGQAQTDGFEPSVALYCGTDPLSLICSLIKQIPSHLRENGRVFLEVGIAQAELVLQKLKDTLSPCCQCGVLADLNGIGRVVWAQVSTLSQHE